jgi:small-conductance mechanosensitive channel
VAVVVPNSEFISHQVVNRSHQAHDTRYRLPIGVAYESDPELVKETLLNVAREHPGVLQDPPPIVIFEKFGESSLDFFLWVWTRSYYNKPYLFRSEMNFAIYAALKNAGITIPFPQRDLHIRSGSRPLD